MCSSASSCRDAAAGRLRLGRLQRGRGHHDHRPPRDDLRPPLDEDQDHAGRRRPDVRLQPLGAVGHGRPRPRSRRGAGPSPSPTAGGSTSTAPTTPDLTRPRSSPASAWPAPAPHHDDHRHLRHSPPVLDHQPRRRHRRARARQPGRLARPADEPKLLRARRPTCWPRTRSCRWARWSRSSSTACRCWATQFLHPSVADIAIPFVAATRRSGRRSASSPAGAWCCSACPTTRGGGSAPRAGARCTASPRWRGSRASSHSLGEGTDAGQIWFLAMLAIVAVPAPPARWPSALTGEPRPRPAGRARRTYRPAGGGPRSPRTRRRPAPSACRSRPGRRCQSASRRPPSTRGRRWRRS